MALYAISFQNVIKYLLDNAFILGKGEGTIILVILL